MRNSTLLFLIQRTGDTITHVCLAMKKRGFGANRWNGAGGKVAPGESVEIATVRETKEEIDVIPHKLEKVAEITFVFPHRPDWDQLVHVFFCASWAGEPHESNEMSPRWFDVADIPYANMWPDDIIWLPKVLHGQKLYASFTFGENDVIIDQKINIVTSV